MKTIKYRVWAEVNKCYLDMNSGYFYLAPDGTFYEITQLRNGKIDYNEVRAMKNYMMNQGVTEESDIFMDHAGFSTYESLYRAKEIFGAKKIVIISNTYHLYRSLYIAEKLGIEAYGVGVTDKYSGKEYREFREILARDKDFLKCIFKPEPTFLGEKIDIHGDGTVTDDEK